MESVFNILYEDNNGNVLKGNSALLYANNFGSYPYSVRVISKTSLKRNTRN
jgi:hypothetical protein